MISLLIKSISLFLLYNKGLYDIKHSPVLSLSSPAFCLPACQSVSHTHFYLYFSRADIMTNTHIYIFLLSFALFPDFPSFFVLLLLLFLLKWRADNNDDDFSILFTVLRFYSVIFSFSIHLRIYLTPVFMQFCIEGWQCDPFFTIFFPSHRSIHYTFFIYECMY